MGVTIVDTQDTAKIKKMKNFHPTGNCPIRDILCRLGDKWSMLVLITLNVNGTMRFSDIQKTISDISQRMLTVTLRTLEADGLVFQEQSMQKFRPASNTNLRKPEKHSYLISRALSVGHWSI